MRTDYSKIQSFMAKNAVKLKEKQLIEEAQAAYEKKIAEENALIEAYDAKKLKSKDAIRRAKAIKAKRAAAKTKDTE